MTDTTHSVVAQWLYCLTADIALTADIYKR